MPRLSVFSIDESDVSIAFLAKPTVRKVKRKVKKTPKTSDHFIPPSVALRNPDFGPPTSEEPKQHAIQPKWKKPIMQMNLRVLATSERREPTHRDPSEQQNVRQMIDSMLSRAPDKRDKNTARCSKLFRLSDFPHEQMWLSNLQLCDFRPLQAPFVCEIIRILVNMIERHCKTHSWQKVFEPLRQLRAEAQAVVLQMIRIRHDEVGLRQIALELTHSMRIATLRALLASFSVRPIHMTKRKLRKLVETPMYDQFLRPNKDLKNFIREIVIPRTRTVVDTLAFIMIHLIHAIKGHVKDPADRAVLAEIYGPLLIGFTERPVIIDRDINPDKSEEAVLMEVILDLCDEQFWNHLGMLKILDCFKDGFYGESKTVLPTSDFPLPTLVRIKDFRNEERARESLARLQMRSTASILHDVQNVRWGRADVPPQISMIIPNWVHSVKLRD